MQGVHRGIGEESERAAWEGEGQQSQVQVLLPYPPIEVPVGPGRVSREALAGQRHRDNRRGAKIPGQSKSAARLVEESLGAGRLEDGARH